MLKKLFSSPMQLLMVCCLLAVAGAASAGLLPPDVAATAALLGVAGTVESAAGTTLRVSASQPATYDAAGYDTLFGSSPGWGSLVGEITNFGDFGREFALITHNPVGSRGTQKLKGSFNEGQLPLTMGLDTDDAGQIKMKAASLSDANYSFVIETQGGDKYYFQAKVMSFKVGIGGVDNVVSANAVLEITTNSAGVGVVESLAA
jgi:hypothetical protein